MERLLNRVKRIWSRKGHSDGTITKSLRFPTIMWTQFEKLAADDGDTPNAYIVLILDQYLQVRLKEDTELLIKQLAPTGGTGTEG